jgi:hypothetical protein
MIEWKKCSKVAEKVKLHTGAIDIPNDLSVFLFWAIVYVCYKYDNAKSKKALVYNSSKESYNKSAKDITITCSSTRINIRKAYLNIKLYSTAYSR